MGARFVSVDRETPMLLPPDLRDWVPEDYLVHFVIEAVECLPLESFRVKPLGHRRQAVPAPHDAGTADLQLRQRPVSLAQDRAHHLPRRGNPFLCAGTHPDHDTICKFRCEINL